MEIFFDGMTIGGPVILLAMVAALVRDEWRQRKEKKQRVIKKARKKEKKRLKHLAAG